MLKTYKSIDLRSIFKVIKINRKTYIEALTLLISLNAVKVNVLVCYNIFKLRFRIKQTRTKF